MIIKGDADYTRALAVLMDRKKYNELDMLRAAYSIINSITYPKAHPKTRERELSILPFSTKTQLMEIIGVLDTFFDGVKVGATEAWEEYVKTNKKKQSRTATG